MDKVSEVPVDILVIEDNPGDVRLIIETFKVSKIPHNLVVATDGEEALQILKNQCKESKHPKLIILDLNLPKKSGREVLKEIKTDNILKHIPVIIFTTSNATEDINQCYHNHANAYINKPIDLDQFVEVINSMQKFWIKTAKLPFLNK